VNFTSVIPTFHASLGGELIRRDGSARSLGVLSGGRIERPRAFWRALWLRLRGELPFFAGMSFGAFLWWMDRNAGIAVALVTTAGMNYNMATFTGAANPMTNFKYHDCGTGAGAENISDVALGAAAGTARVAGAQSNPTAIQFQSVATISFTAALAITEWGLFSATVGGSLWDRRKFAVINVVNTDSIQFTYLVSGTAGGS
jgi:hypothetical protein